MKQYINRKSIGMFCMVFFCLAVLVGSIVTTSYFRSKAKETSDYVAVLEDNTNSVFNHVSQPISSVIGWEPMWVPALWQWHSLPRKTYKENSRDIGRCPG